MCVIGYEPADLTVHPPRAAEGGFIFSSFFFFRKNYLLLSCATSVRPSVRPSVCPSVRPSVRLSVCPSVRPSVEIISFLGNSLPNRPIELKIGLNVREGVVHVRKA